MAGVAELVKKSNDSELYDWLKENVIVLDDLPIEEYEPSFLAHEDKNVEKYLNRILDDVDEQNYRDRNDPFRRHYDDDDDDDEENDLDHIFSLENEIGPLYNTDQIIDKLVDHLLR